MYEVPENLCRRRRPNVVATFGIDQNAKWPGHSPTISNSQMVRSFGWRYQSPKFSIEAQGS